MNARGAYIGKKFSKHRLSQTLAYIDVVNQLNHRSENTSDILLDQMIRWIISEKKPDGSW